MASAPPHPPRSWQDKRAAEGKAPLLLPRKVLLPPQLALPDMPAAAGTEILGSSQAPKAAAGRLPHPDHAAPRPMHLQQLHQQLRQHRAQGQLPQLRRRCDE